jgi:hypothetical protein
MQAPLQARNDSDAAQTDTAKTVAQTRVLAENRPEAVAQHKLAEIITGSPRVLQQRALSDAICNNPRMVAQRREMNALFGGMLRPHEDGAMSSKTSLAERVERPNNTGLPDQLKSGIESLSGMSMDHVTVHYNSDKPAQLQAHAYAHGNEIYLGAGQERHLPHEAWHVVQQAQGRVKPTVQMEGGVRLNDDARLENEATAMGNRAMQFMCQRGSGPRCASRNAGIAPAGPIQRVAGVVQLLAPPELSDMRQYYWMIQNRIPANWANRLAILLDVPQRFQEVASWQLNRQRADGLWQHWQAVYSIMESGGQIANPPLAVAMAAASNRMFGYFTAFNAVHGLLIDNGLADVKRQLVDTHYVVAGAPVIPGFNHAFYTANADETLAAFKIRVRTNITAYLTPGEAAWLAGAGYAGNDPVVVQLPPLTTLAGTNYSIHWTLFQNNLGALAGFWVDALPTAILAALVPSGAGDQGVHVSLEVLSVGDAKPRVFGRPADPGTRARNGHNRPAGISWANMAARLDAQNLVQENRVLAWANVRNGHIRPGWGAH